MGHPATIKPVNQSVEMQGELSPKVLGGADMQLVA